VYIIKQKWPFWRAGLYPANQSKLKKFLCFRVRIRVRAGVELG